MLFTLVNKIRIESHADIFTKCHQLKYTKVLNLSTLTIQMEKSM